MKQLIAYLGWAAFFAYLALAPAGCQTYAQEFEPAPTWVADPELAPAALAAAEDWCAATEGAWCPTIAEAGEGARLRVADASPAEHGDWCAWHVRPSDEIAVVYEPIALHGHCRLAPPWNSAHETLRGIIAHELGHAAGLVDGAAEGVMRSGSGATGRVTEADGAAVRHLLGAR